MPVRAAAAPRGDSLPLFYMNRDDPYYQEPFWGLVLSTVLASILFAWVYNNSGRSVLAAMVIHASFNWGHVAIPTLGSDRASLTLIALQVIVIAVVLLIWGPRTLTRGSTLADDNAGGGAAGSA